MLVKVNLLGLHVFTVHNGTNCLVARKTDIRGRINSVACLNSLSCGHMSVQLSYILQFFRNIYCWKNILSVIKF